MRKQLLPCVLVGSTIIGGLTLDSWDLAGLNRTILYALPLAVGARYASPRIVGLLTILALALDGISLLDGTTPIELWPLKIVALAVIGLLAVQVADLREREARRRREAEIAREQLQTFMGMVAHDLRNPLTVALGYTQLYQRRLTERDQRGSDPILEKLESALLRVDRLARDLLDATRIGAGRFSVAPVPTDLAQLVTRAVLDAQASCPTHQIVLDGPEGLRGDWDPDRLRQVVANLLTNAVKYSPIGSDIRVSLRESNGEIQLSVADHGSGIAPERLDQLFQPFERLGRNGAADGTGLGLYISRSIVEAHGGRIWVESVPGGGSAFCITLPSHPVAGQVPAALQQADVRT
jgi:signal transduction histidine kinase